MFYSGINKRFERVGNTIFSAIRNLGTFYFSTVAPLDWTSPQNDDLWQDGAKALFDPCPSGWRVPKGGTENRSPWYNFSLPDTFTPNAPTISFASGVNAGHQFYRFGTSGSTAWFPAAGLRGSMWGGFGGVGDNGHSRTSTRAGTKSFYLDFYGGSTNISHSEVCTYGFPVRCLRE